jgi:ketosteroid isomerase-like protein
MDRKVVLDFIGRINAHDVEGLLELLHKDHVFIDAVGREARGRYLIRNAWKEYFEWFPDYRLVQEEIYHSKNRFVVLGFASGTYRGLPGKEATWMLPAAWRAVVEDGRMKEWQVYCDTKTVLDIMEKHR